MCGIVGYYGPNDPKEVLMTGLKKLEYRGYDSAGVAILDQGHFRRIRAEGKLVHLEKRLENEKFDGQLGIGHTRWATHGAPSERNAHPHQVGGVSLVHNGIIENYQELREQLVAGGADITSDTDSELVAHLIAHEVEETQDLYKAIERVLPKLRGAFSILAVWEKQPTRLVAFKDGPPLVVGLGEGENFIASDVQAVLPYTRRVVHLDDLEVALIDKDKVEFYSANGFAIEKKVQEINWDPEISEKQGYPHYMLKEIYEQPRVVASAIDPHINIDQMQVQLSQLGFQGATIEELGFIDANEDRLATEELFKSLKRVCIVACGTSYHAGLIGKYLIEKFARIPVDVDIASEFRYRDPVTEDGTLFVTISQSGETADTLAALRLVKKRGVKVLSICNVRNSTIDREADGHLYLNAGPEIGVASTKAFVAMLALMNLVALQLAKTKGVLSRENEKVALQALVAIPSQMEAVLAYDKFFAEAAETLKAFRGFLYMGRGVSYPIALEGALKLKELAYMHAEGYAAGEMKHGPLALIDERMAIVMVAPSDDLYEKTVSNLEEAKARGGQIISIGTGSNERLKNVSSHYLALPATHWSCNPLLAVVPLQLLSYHLADSLGFNVDQPRNLAKSVTVE